MKISKNREKKKKLDYRSVMDSENPKFGELLCLLKQYPKKQKDIVKKILDQNPKLEHLAILYNRLKNSMLKSKVYDYYHKFVGKQVERHCGSNEDFHYLVDSVLIEKKNPFYMYDDKNINIKGFIDDILLNWQRAPLSYESMSYLFDILYGGIPLRIFNEISSVKPGNTILMYINDKNIEEIFKNAYFGVAFPGMAPEVSANLRKYYLAEIFEILVSCIQQIGLQFGNTNCCNEITENTLHQIENLKKYANMLHLIGAINAKTKKEKIKKLSLKEKEIRDNQKKWAT